jgi:hypothetical protein
MKALLFVLVMATAAHAQTPEELMRQRYGIKGGPTNVGIPLRPIQPKQSYASSDAPILRVVNGQPYNIRKSILWHDVEGKCLSVHEGGIILQTFSTNAVYEQYHVSAPPNVAAGAYAPEGAYGPRKRLVSKELVPDKAIFVRNYLVGAEGKNLRVPAMQAGTTNIDGHVIELWDCGTPYIPPKEPTIVPSKSDLNGPK